MRISEKSYISLTYNIPSTRFPPLLCITSSVLKMDILFFPFFKRTWRQAGLTYVYIYSERKGNLIYYNLVFFVLLADMWKRRKCSDDVT